MKYSLRTKLTVSFAATALICVLLIGLFSNIQLERHFKEYVKQNQVKKNQEIVGLIASKLQRDGTWDILSIQDIGIYAMEQGLILQVRDADGTMLWDAYTYNQGMCRQMLLDMSNNMMMQNPGWHGELTQETFPLKNGAKILGTVDIAYYGPVYFNEIDIHFISTLNNVLISVGLFSLVLALIFGAILSSWISKPIISVIRTAQSIAMGTYGDRSRESSSTLEISQLTESVNNLAATLETQEALRKRLTGDVAHELRTPLATLQSHVEAMIDGVWEPTTERLSSCHEEITRITRLVSDLEKLAHYESEGLVLNKTEFPAREFIERLMQTFETAFKQKQITFEIDADDSCLRGDRDKLSQVLINLIANALKFTPDNGTVTLTVRGTSQDVRLSVVDTGLGIATQDLPHIFQRFYRADVSRNRTTGGAGIGLTVVKAIVEAHNGTIEVESEINRGTRFTMTFPK